MKAELIGGSEDGRILEIFPDEQVLPKLELPFKRTTPMWVETKDGGYWDKFGKMIYELDTIIPHPKYKFKRSE